MELAEAQRKLGISAPATPLIFSLPLVNTAGTVSIPKSTAAVDGFLAAVDFANFSAKEVPLTFSLPLLRTANNIAMPVSSAVADGYLSSTSFSAFTAKVSASRSIATTAPITGGGDLSSDRTFAMAAATTLVDGYLSAANFVIFNNKVATTRSIATTAPLTGGGDLSADRTFSLDFTVAWTWTALNIAATPTDRITLTNTQAAISGTQQYSPALRFTGQGFKTDATTGSKATDFRIYNQPVQAAGNPTAALLIDYSVDGGAFANKYSFNSAGTFLAVQNVQANSGQVIMGSLGFGMPATVPAYWVSSSNATTGTTDTKLVRDGAAGVLALHNGTTNAGAHRIYNTLTSATSFERLDLQWASNVAQIWTEKGSGGGTARDLVLGADATEILRFQTGSKLGFFAIATPVAQQVLGGAVTNNVTAGGTTRTIANYTDLTLYANDAAAIRNNIYQLAETQKSVVAALRNYGLLT